MDTSGDLEVAPNAGGGTAFHHGQRSAFGGAEVVEKEYQKAVETFPFPVPEGFVFPSRAPLSADHEGALFETGYGAALALDCWTSAMEASILSAGEDLDFARARTLAQSYLKATVTHFFQRFIVDPDDITGRFLRDVTERDDFNELRAWRLGGNQQERQSDGRD